MPSPGQIAYESYARFAGGADLTTMERLVAWNELPPFMRDTWMYVAQQIEENFRRRAIASLALILYPNHNISEVEPNQYPPEQLTLDPIYQSITPGRHESRRDT